MFAQAGDQSCNQNDVAFIASLCALLTPYLYNNTCQCEQCHRTDLFLCFFFIVHLFFLTGSFPIATQILHFGMNAIKWTDLESQEFSDTFFIAKVVKAHIYSVWFWVPEKRWQLWETKSWSSNKNGGPLSHCETSLLADLELQELKKAASNFWRCQNATMWLLLWRTLTKQSFGIWHEMTQKTPAS